MKNPSILVSHALKVFAALKEERRAQLGRELTVDELAALNDEFRRRLEEDLLRDQPKVEPGLLARLLQRFIPSVRLTTAEERKKRTALRDEAAKAYAQAYAEVYGYRRGNGSFARDRAEHRVVYWLSEKEREHYTELHQQSKASYYQGQNLSEEAVNAAIARARRDISLYHVRAMGTILAQYSDMLACECSDQVLIRDYPKLLNAIVMVTEGVDLLKAAIKDLKPFDFPEIPQETIQQYLDQSTRLMSYTPVLQKRMSILADPHYPYLRLEGIYEADIIQLRALEDVIHDDNFLAEMGIRLESAVQEVHVINPNPQPEPPAEEQPQPQEEAPQQAAPRPRESAPYANLLDSEDNLLSLPGNMAAAKPAALLQRIADRLGVSFDDLERDYRFCDRNGHTFDINDVKLMDYLHSWGGELYVVGNHGTQDPLPVLLDPARSSLVPRVGKEAVLASPDFRPKKPSISWISKLVNRIYKGGTGNKTAAMEKYEAALKKYENDLRYLRNKAELAGGQLPPAVLRTARDMQLEKLQEAHRRTYENDLTLLLHRPLTEAQFDRTLGHLLAVRSFRLPEDSRVRMHIFDLLGVYRPGFSEGRAIDSFRESNPFREYMRWLRRERPDLLEALLSGEEVRRSFALNEIGELLAASWDRCRELAEEKEAKGIYRQEDAAAKLANAQREQVQPGQLLSENGWASLKKEHDNACYWETILSFYGPVRKLRPDWIDVSSKVSVYTMEDWLELQKSDVDISQYKPDGIPMDERTFAALNMVLSQRRTVELTPQLMQRKDYAPYTMPFEDLFISLDGPRPDTGQILLPVVEPSRAKLLERLAELDTPQGKRALARDLAAPLHLLACRCSKMRMNDRKYTAMAEVCMKTMDFLRAHGVEELLEEEGLPREELESLRTTCAVGKAACEGFHAAEELLLHPEQYKGEALRERLDRILLLRALRADLLCHDSNPDLEASLLREQTKRQPELDALAKLKQAGYLTREESAARENGILGEAISLSHQAWDDFRCRYFPAVIDLRKDGSALKKLSYRMMSSEDREKLVQEGPRAVLEKLCSGELDKLSQTWADTLKQEEKAQETRAREQKKLAQLEMRMNVLNQDPTNRELVDAVRLVLKNGSRTTQLMVADMSDEELLAGLRRQQELALQKDEAEAERQAEEEANRKAREAQQLGDRDEPEVPGL